MSLELDPVELGFRRPFNTEVEEKLRLRNPNSDPVAFKVKTTAPKQYCVRPNSGRVESGGTVEVSVLLQAMKEEPPSDAKCRDKFLVQSVPISASDEMKEVTQIWSGIESSARGSIQEKKIRVNFLPPLGTTQPGAYSTSTPSRLSTSATSATDDQPPAYSSPASTQKTPAQGPVSSFDDRPADASNMGNAKSQAGNPAMGVTGAVGAAASSVASAVPTSQEELQAQLTAAQNKISMLTEQANEGLRQRKSATSSSTGSGASSGSSGLATQQSPGGVPVPLVAALCLLSFLLAYLLF